MNEQQIRQYIIGRLVDLGLLDATRAAVLSSTGADLALKELEMDSFGLIELSMALEETTDRIVEPTDLVKVGSLNALAAWVVSKVAA
jgi:acyl carrier protein